MRSRASLGPVDADILLSAADVREIDRLLRKLQARGGGDALADRDASGPSAHSPATDELLRSELVERARLVLSERRRRVKFLSKSMFGEPAWDILLHLYTAKNMALTVGKVVSLIGEPKTTVLRWAAYLEEKQLIARRDDSSDRRLVWIDLIDRGRELLDEYFRTARESSSAGE